MTSLGKAWAALILLFSTLGTFVAGCDKVAQARPAVVLTASELAARPALYGGDTRAWLTDRGGNNDGGYCAAKLKLPLATEPSWEFAYSAAEFSNNPATTILHYAGRIYLTADSPQLVALDAQTGKVLLNKDVYAHKDSDANEELNRIYAHPQGLLLGQDNLGRFYAWDLLDEALPQLWLGPELDSVAGFVLDGELMLTSWDDQLYGLDVLSGEPRWQFPSASQSGGVVLSQSGIEIWWSSEGRLYALQATDGVLLWSITTADLIDRVIIDEPQQLTYVTYGNESVECRRLNDGAVRWQYSWASIVNEAERKWRYEQLLERLKVSADSLGLAGVTNQLDEIALSPDGVLLSLSNGSVVALDKAGKIRWLYHGQASVTRMVVFENAALIEALYAPPGYLFWDRAAYCLVEPDWPLLKHTRMLQAEAQGGPVEEPARPQGTPGLIPNSTPPGPPHREVFPRFAALDLRTGQELSSFEPELFPVSALVPARGNVVFTEAPVSWAVVGESGRGRKLRVLAYPWIEWEGD
jgi:outer membrane protein assembly factor BamB